MSEIKADKISGTTSANAVTVTGENGSTQTSLQQGLAKAWGHVSASGSTTLDGSFNYASVTDNGTGDWTYAFTNNMNNDDYSFLSIHGGASSNSAFSRPQTYAAASIRFWTYTGSGVADVTLVTNTVHGDLA